MTATVPGTVPAAGDAPVVLRLENIRKSFGDAHVLNGISFDIRQHEVVALLGPSGSGKSTLMKCVNLLEQVDDGQIWLGGTDITCESFLIGFDGNLYGDEVRLEFFRYIAPTRRFENLDQLRDCIADAARQSAAYFGPQSR